jgi:hypothetical protein
VGEPASGAGIGRSLRPCRTDLPRHSLPGNPYLMGRRRGRDHERHVGAPEASYVPTRPVSGRDSLACGAACDPTRSRGPGARSNSSPTTESNWRSRGATRPYRWACSSAIEGGGQGLDNGCPPHGLSEEGHHSKLLGARACGVLNVCRDHDEGGIPSPFLQGFDHVQTVHFRHQEIGDDAIGLVLDHGGKTLTTVVGGENLEARLFGDGSDQRSLKVRVIDNQDC